MTENKWFSHVDTPFNFKVQFLMDFTTTTTYGKQFYEVFIN